jgi:hypothetical protein
MRRSSRSTSQLGSLLRGILTTLWGRTVTSQSYVGATNSGPRFAGPPAQYGVRVLKIIWHPVGINYNN